jgi:hypothetical protein
MSNLINRCWKLLTYLFLIIGSAFLIFLRMKAGCKDEHDPVTDDEFILRKIHKNNYKPGKDPPVVRVAFEPKDEDHDGLSFYREHFANAERVSFSGRKRGEYYIARFSVSLLRGPDYQFTIDPAPIPDLREPRGHCVIREMSIEQLLVDEGKSKSLQRRLSRIASNHIVYVPLGCKL